MCEIVLAEKFTQLKRACKESEVNVHQIYRCYVIDIAE